MWMRLSDAKQTKHATPMLRRFSKQFMSDLRHSSVGGFNAGLRLNPELTIITSSLHRVRCQGASDVQELSERSEAYSSGSPANAHRGRHMVPSEQGRYSG